MFLTLGSGVYIPCWRRSCSYNAISQFMPSCTQCYFSNKHETSLGYSSDTTVPPAISCDVCLNWDARNDSELAYFKPPPNYPFPENLIDGKYLKEHIITFKGLANVWNRMGTNVWYLGEKQAVSYL
jgi:hypothetical protein